MLSGDCEAMQAILAGDRELQTVPAAVVRYCAALGLAVHEVRWCEWCGVVAPAIDHHQRSMLDAVGFDTLCPECKCPAGP